MKKFQEFMGKQELLLEMAKLGEVDALALIIWTRDPGNIPHIHIVDIGTEGEESTFTCTDGRVLRNLTSFILKEE